jgi:hypothetical protein
MSFESSLDRAIRQLAPFAVVAVAIGATAFFFISKEASFAILEIVKDMSLGSIVAIISLTVFILTLPATFAAFLRSDSVSGRRDIEQRVEAQLAEIRREKSSLSETERKALRQDLQKRVGEDLASEAVRAELKKLFDAQKKAAEADPFSELSKSA